MNTFIFDLLGTLIDHQNKQSLPTLSAILNRLHVENPGSVAIVTKYDENCARHLCLQAGFSMSIPVFGGEHRQQLVHKALEATSPERAFYFDDSPTNLRQVSEMGMAVLQGRVLAFTGDRQSCREKQLADKCAAMGIPLALSPYDVLHVLGRLSWFEEFCQQHRELKWTAQEVAFLIPGLNHPFSVFGGDAERAIYLPLQEVPEDQWEPIWFNLGWIGAAASACTLLLTSVKRSLGIEYDLFGGADEAWTMSASAAAKLDRGDRRGFCDTLKRAINLAQQGVEEIGIVADRCRPHGLPFHDSDRINRIRGYLQPLL